jgi:hypothetical protein
MPRKITAVVVVYGANQADVQAAQEHSLTRQLDPRGWFHVMKQDKIGAFVRPNAALVSLAAPSPVRIQYHSIALELRMRDLRQADRASASFRKKPLRSVDVFANGFPETPGARQPSRLTTDVSPIYQYAGASGRCTYSRSPHYCAPCRSPCHASDAHRSSWSSYPGRCGFNGQ